MQVLFTIAVSEEGKTITVAGQDIPNLKVGALKDALEIYNKSEQLKALIRSYNKTDRVFEFNSGSKMEFKSYDDSQDAKSGKRDYLFVNEANGIPYDVYNELALRTYGRVFIDYNPNAKFWVHENLIGREGVELIVSDHRHNPFLPQSVRDKIESLKDVDIELWKVYARGLTGRIEGLVFRNWEEIDSVPSDAKYLGTGMDFGFTNDPTAVVDIYRYNGEVIVDEVLYERGLTNPDIAGRLVSHKGKTIVADSAEPKSIEELRRLGMSVIPCEKGKDSINLSIDVLKRFKLKVTKRSRNLQKELNSYKWATEKDGSLDRKPVDFNNHAIDALRYVAMRHLQQSMGATVSFR